mgnify:CR=1 FL=1
MYGCNDTIKNIVVPEYEKEIAELSADIERKDEALKEIYEISDKGISTYEIGVIQRIIEEALLTKEAK